MKLINGRGQIGDLFNSDRYKYIDCTLYHTWNFMDKSKEVQKKCYLDFIDYIDKHQYERIIFISTASEEENEYTKYKSLAEQYLIKNLKQHVILKMPNIIGKGICTKFRTLEVVEAYGRLKLITLEDAFYAIHDELESSFIGIKVVQGEDITAELAMKLIQFGVGGKA